MADTTLTAAAMSPVECDRLRKWLERQPGIGRIDDLAVETAEGGKSNLTFLVSAVNRRWVVRRPPLGPRLPTAHNMLREFEVLQALEPSEVPVPRVLAYCADEDVIGAPFYAMEHLSGRVIREPADCDFSPDEARRSSLALIRTLALLHLADYQRLGLGSFGRPEGFMTRQLTRWHEQLERSRARELPDLDHLGRELSTRLPLSSFVGIVHGDYRIDNVVLDEHDPGRIIGVLDWEMATIGDPLADLGMLLMYWGEPGEVVAAPVQAITTAPGFLSRAEVAGEYERLVDGALPDLDFYVAFANFKLAVIVEGIHARHLAGNTVGPGFDGIGDISPRLAANGLRLLS